MLQFYYLAVGEIKLWQKYQLNSTVTAPSSEHAIRFRWAEFSNYKQLFMNLSSFLQHAVNWQHLPPALQISEI